MSHQQRRPNPGQSKQSAAAHRYESYKKRAQDGLSDARNYARQLRQKYIDELPEWNEHIKNQNHLSSSIAAIKTTIHRRHGNMNDLQSVIHRYSIKSPSGQKASSELSKKQTHQETSRH